MHNTTGFSVGYLQQKHPLGFNHLYNNTCTCIVDEVERRSQVLKVIGES